MPASRRPRSCVISPQCSPRGRRGDHAARYRQAYDRRRRDRPARERGGLCDRARATDRRRDQCGHRADRSRRSSVDVAAHRRVRARNADRLAVARELVVCGARDRSAAQRACARPAATVPRVGSGGRQHRCGPGRSETVLVHTADRLLVLDAGTGRVRARSRATTVRPSARRRSSSRKARRSDHVRARRVMARVPHLGMIRPGRSRRRRRDEHRAVEDGVLVALEDGDAIRIDAQTGAAAGSRGSPRMARRGRSRDGRDARRPDPGPPDRRRHPLRRRTAQGGRSRPRILTPSLWTPIRRRRRSATAGSTRSTS